MDENQTTDRQNESLRIGQALRESEENLIAIFDASPDAIVITDGSGTIVLASRQVEALLGYAHGELIGQSINKLVPEDSRFGHPAMCNSYLAAPSRRLMGSHREIAALRKDGKLCDVEIGLSPIPTTLGLFVACALRDIRERREAEDSLHQLSQKLKHLYELSTLGIALTDMNGHFLEVNRAFQQISGYKKNELRSLDYWALTPSHFIKEEAYQLELLEHTSRYGPYEKEYVRKDGSTVPVRLNGVLIRNRKGEKFIWSIVEDITLQKQAEVRIRELAFSDQLTGLPNRALLRDRLRLAIESSGRTRVYGGALLIDLDNFKTVNDTRGHGAGDLLLKKIADVLKEGLRYGDTVARLGGDEFFVILPDLAERERDAAAGIEASAKKILAAVDRPVLLGTDYCRCTASIGATLYLGPNTTVEEVMKQADLAMYRAKAGGRNTLRFFDPEMEATVLARITMETDLRAALQGDQFALHYQVQVSDQEQLHGAEALIRWHHPTRGMVMPNDFIKLAEETGLIAPIGNWVLQEACRQLAAWAHFPELANISISVNVSVHQFGQADFVHQVLSAISLHQANPAMLKIELTESALMQKVPAVIEKMNALKAVGVRFSLDDFGTGYSSLAYLKMLPLDQLKIDRSFIRDVLSDPNDHAIVKTIIALADKLQLSVIAEGVETIGQVDLLKAEGCQCYQGYFFSMPLAVEQFEAFCRSKT